MFQRIFFLVIKEILAITRDKKSRLVLIFPPLMQLFIFAFAATLDVKNVHIGILNRDSGEVGFRLTESFNGSPIFTKISYLKSVNEIQPFLDNQEGVMVLSIDDQFSKNLHKKKKTTVEMLFDGRKSNTVQIVAGYANSVIASFNKEFVKQNGIQETKTELVPRNWFNPNLIYTWFNVPNLSGVLTMLISLIVTSLSIARERELGTFDQLLVSPLQPIEILIGKSIPAIIIGLLEGTVIVLAAIFVFKVPFVGSFFYLYLGMFVFICSIVGVGLFISSLSSTQQQAILGAFVFMAPAILLSGYATPVENMPTWLQKATYANPLRFYLIIAKGEFLKAMSFNIVFKNLIPMIIVAFFTLSISTWFFKNRME